MVLDYLTIAAGGALGALTRYLIGLTLIHSPGAVPWSTLAANLLGSLLLGYFSRANTLGHRQMLFLAVGFLGSLTTFSTFAYEIVDRAERGLTGTALGYAATTLLCGSLAAWVGAEIAHRRAGTRS